MGNVLSFNDDHISSRAITNAEMAERLRHLATFIEKCPTHVMYGMVLLTNDLGQVSRYPFGSDHSKTEAIGILSIGHHQVLHDRTFDMLGLIAS